MKKGCFLTIIIIVTMIIGIGFYLFNKYGDQLLNFGKEKLVEIAFDETVDKITNLKDSKYNDSLKVKLKEYFSNFNTEDMNRADEIINKFEYFIGDDNLIDSTEYNKLIELLNKK